MEKITIGLIREGKVPPDKRVPLTPKQCRLLETRYPHVKLIVQPSPIRAFKDEEYAAEGIELSEDLSTCDIIMGVKEVNEKDLIPNKKFMFFSHTIKKQPYNRDLLRAIVAKQVQLIDYEVLRNTANKRVIGFGRYAGIVGCYNAILTYGLKHNLFELIPANQCQDRKQVEEELARVQFPSTLKIVLTGYGRVGHGAREILDQLPIKEVTPEEFITQEFTEPVYTHLDAEDYYARRSDGGFEKSDFYANPQGYACTFSRFLSKADIYIPCHFWSNKADVIIKKDDLKAPDLRLTVLADISCDIDCAIASTVRSSTIADPIYGYNPHTGLEDDWRKEGVLAVMAVDNLPCELPKDASEDFGNELLKEVLPALLLDDKDDMIARASETNLKGELTEHFAYLEDYLMGKE